MAAAETSPPSTSSTSRPSSSSAAAAATTSVVQLGAEADAPLPIDGRSPPSLLAIGRLVGRRLRVTVSDGRVLSGVLSCLDPQGNLVLSDTLTLGGGGGGGGGGGAGREGGEKGEAAATAAHPPPLSLDDGHHHSRTQAPDQTQPQQQQQQQQQDHAMGMVIVPRARRVRCCVEVEGFEAGRVGAELARAMEEEEGSER